MICQPGYAHRARRCSRPGSSSGDASYDGERRGPCTWLVLGDREARRRWPPQRRAGAPLPPVAAIDDLRRRGGVRLVRLAARWAAGAAAAAG
jgi:hypothetical protein